MRAKKAYTSLKIVYISEVFNESREVPKEYSFSISRFLFPSRFSRIVRLHVFPSHTNATEIH